MTAQVIKGDARTLPLDDASMDAIVCDPPYELSFMGRRWDRTGVAYDVDTWREAMRVLKPGGHMLAFGGTRTWHRLACAIEDAGFELRDNIAWMYGSGFPKSLDVSKAIDKAAGAEREVVGTSRWDSRKPNGSAGVQSVGLDDARRWQGWGTALKPAFEPIVVARKPIVGTVAANVLAHGCGGINVDGCRVGTTVETWPASRSYRPGSFQPTHDGTDPTQRTGAAPPGRWPTNVVLSHPPLLDDDGEPVGDACADGCVDGCPVAELDAQSGLSRSPGTYGHGDVGGASRFFPVFRYQAKAPARERPKVDGVAHPTVKPLGLMRWLVRLVTPPGGNVLDQFAGSGSTVEAALLEGFSVVGVDSDEDGHYIPMIEQRIERVRK